MVQYVGRLLRQWPGKREVRVYDYADLAVPALKKMNQRRMKAYESLGFVVREERGDQALWTEGSA